MPQFVVPPGETQESWLRKELATGLSLRYGPRPPQPVLDRVETELAVIEPLIDALGAGGVMWLALGGVCYSVGVIFYMSRRMPYSHAVWHVFVLAGSVCHFFAVWLHVLPVDGLA